MGTGSESAIKNAIELDILAAASAELETAPASKIIRWATDRFGGDLVYACSFQDVVLLDLAVKEDPMIEVIFLDTRFHFPETLEFVEQVRSQYNLNLTVTTPGPEAEQWPCGTTRCCEFRKVAPLEKALAGKAAWLTGLKRVDATTRVETPIVSWDEARSMVKINPLATWTEVDVSGYISDHDLLVHPLVSKGYVSIGCAPTTRPIVEGEDPRSGRWADSGKIECGLHV